MTLPSRITPELAEDRAVQEEVSLTRRMRKVEGVRLLTAKMDWERLYNSANPPGAPEPHVAKARLTRDSRRRWELVRLTRRQEVGKLPRTYLLAKAITL